MSEHIRTDDIHDWLDGLLPAEARRRLDDHVATCSACADEVARWTAVVAPMRALPQEARPERDLWPGIEARLAERGSAAGRSDAATTTRDARGPRRTEEADVLPLPVGRRAERPARPRGRVTLTFPQLWAAGVALALASGSLVWVALGGPRSDARTALGTPDAVPAPAEVRPVRAAVAEYDRAVDELTTLLDAGRELLAPETVAAIERSLASIDAAIGEAERALAADPASPVLNRLLLNHQQTKLRILRQATSGLLPRT